MQIDKAAAIDAVRTALCERFGYKDDITAGVETAITTDMAYIDGLGGDEYDEDKAYNNIVRALKGKVKSPESFADDFAEAWESYLNLIGAIEWDG